MLVTRRVIRCVGGALVSSLLLAPLLEAGGKPLSYPQARKGDQVDEYHGVKVADPYRWLEDPVEDPKSEEVRAWIEAENKVTFGWLEEIPARARIKERLTKLYDFERYGLPSKESGRYFFSKNNGLQNQNVVYWMQSLTGEPAVLIDPNKMSTDGTVSLAGTTASEDGKLFAYAIAAKGSDWNEWKVRDVDTGTDRTDHIKWAKFSGASWTKDGQGFFYGRYDEPKEGTKFTDLNYFQKLYYHRLGTPQAEDKLTCERKDEKEWSFAGTVTDDGRYLIINVSKGTDPKNLIFYKGLQAGDSPVVELIKEFEADYSFIDNDGPTFWFQTDLEAPRKRVIAVDTRTPQRSNWKEIIPQAGDTLRSVHTVGNHFICEYLKDAFTQVKVFDVRGKFIREVPLPGLGTAGGFAGKRHDPETFYSFTSFTQPTTIYRYDVISGKSRVFRQPKVDFKTEDYQTTQTFFTSKDGTRVPMFITHKKGMEINGDNPALLYGYGGFDIAITPAFRPSTALWLEMGGIYAVANLRGGGEYGKEWHEGGMKLNKQHVFDDFIAAAEWLIANKYTSPSKLAIQGASNGGLLVGAAMTQRPDLFAAALPAVGVMDMLRFNKFTIGWGWTSDYGSPENSEEFKALYAYSPLHHLQSGTAYPATLITTGDHDDRVPPAHSFKFAAALQEAHKGANPVLIRIQTKAGHGAGKPTSMQIEEAADQWAFLARTLNMTVAPSAEASKRPERQNGTSKGMSE